MVMTAPVVVPAAAPAVEEDELVNHGNHEPDHEEPEDHEESNSNYSAELQTEGIEDHRIEEDRTTELEKNQRVQKQLMVRHVCSCVPLRTEGQMTPVCIYVYTDAHTNIQSQ